MKIKWCPFKRETSAEGEAVKRKLPPYVKTVAVIFAVAVVSIILGVLLHDSEDVTVRSELIFEGSLENVFEQDDERASTYIIGASQLPTAVQTFLQVTEGSRITNALVYPALAEYAAGEYEYVLADSIEFEEDGKTAHITVSDDVCFSDGCALTADDVIYSYAYCLSPDIPYDLQSELLHISGAVEYNNGNADTITGIEKVSENELLIHFSSVTVDNFAVFEVPIIHAADHNEETASERNLYLGCGSYAIESHTMYKEIILVRNEYAAEAGEYERIKITVADLDMLETQEIDTMIIPSSMVETVMEMGSYNIYERYSTNRDFLIFNLDNVQMGIAENRKAIASLIDTNDLFELCYSSGRVSTGLSAGNKADRAFWSIFDKTKNDAVDSLVFQYGYSGTETALMNALTDSFAASGVSMVGRNVDTSSAVVDSNEVSLYYYSGEIETLLESWDLNGFYSELDGRTLEECGDLFEKFLAENVYALPLTNSCYYTVSLCDNEDSGILSNLY